MVKYYGILIFYSLSQDDEMAPGWDLKISRKQQSKNGCKRKFTDQNAIIKNIKRNRNRDYFSAKDVLILSKFLDLLSTNV